MKKILRLVVYVAGLLFSHTGCLNEKYTLCSQGGAEPTITLMFRLSDGNGGCKFLSCISVVDLAIYDEQGKCVHSECITRERLSQYKGAKLQLPAGTYQVVAWGNILENSMYEDIQATWLKPGPHVQYSHIEKNRVVNADKVHYAPIIGKERQPDRINQLYTMAVDPATGHNGVLEFTEAYKILNIYIEGYGGTPDVELHQLPRGLTWFGMDPPNDLDDSFLYVTASQKTSEIEIDRVPYDYVMFDTFFFDRHNHIQLEVIERTGGKTAFSVSLNEAVGEPALLDGIEINLLISFTPLGVEVAIPRWKKEEVIPGIAMSIQYQ